MTPLSLLRVPQAGKTGSRQGLSALGHELTPAVSRCLIALGCDRRQFARLVLGSGAGCQRRRNRSTTC